MKLILLKTNLIEGLNSVEKAVSSNQNLPILNNIKINVIKNEGFIDLISTDLEMAITKKISGKIISDGVAIVPFNLLNKIIKNLNSEKINIEKKENKLLINSDNYEAIINCENEDDYPIIPDIQDKKEVLKIKKDLFKDVLSKTLVATSHSDIRPEINGIFIYYDGKNMMFAGTDSFRLIEKTIDYKNIESSFKEVNFTIPTKTAETLIKTLEEDDFINIYVDSNQILFETKNLKIISRIVDGKFPDYKNVIPKESKTDLTLDKNEILNAIKITSSFSGKANDVVLNIIDKGRVLEVLASDNSLGENKYRVPINKIEGEKEDQTIIFNWRYIEEGIKIFDGDKIRFNIDESGKTVIKADSNKNLLYVVMPIRG
ncbi:MAG: DNA polymerase III subunit beta [Candidatus Paceibacterota bacterium]